MKITGVLHFEFHIFVKYLFWIIINFLLSYSSYSENLVTFFRCDKLQELYELFFSLDIIFLIFYLYRKAERNTILWAKGGVSS